MFYINTYSLKLSGMFPTGPLASNAPELLRGFFPTCMYGSYRKRRLVALCKVNSSKLTSVNNPKSKKDKQSRTLIKHEGRKNLNCCVCTTKTTKQFRFLFEGVL